MPSALRTALLTLLLASALALAAASSPAQFLLTTDQDFSITWNDLDFIASGTTTECDVTLTGTLHDEVFEKAGGPIGDITQASISACNAGAGATLLTADLPWPIRYRSFSGTLPGITAIAFGIIDMALRFDPAGALPACLFRTELSEPFVSAALRDFETGQIDIVDADVLSWIDLGEDVDFACTHGGDFEFNGNGLLTDGTGDALFSELEEEEGPEDGPETPADLRASPTGVTIEQLEASGTFTLRNEGGATATIDSVSDESAAQFDVSGCGGTETIVVNASCVYTVQVDERPLESGRVTVTYDDGVNAEPRRVSVEVDIRGVDTEADLRGDPSSVTIGELEQNDILEIRNNGGGLTGIIDRVTTTTSDREAPDFTVTRTGCGERLTYNEACHYLISVNARPETSGRITVEYDDGTGDVRSTVVEVDIAGPDPAELLSTPGEVSIERLESNDSFVIRNLSPDTAALINRVTLTSDDRERPEFSVTGIGCPETYLAGSSCTYIVSVNSRPEADGRYEIEYDDGAGSDRTVTTTIDIAS